MAREVKFLVKLRFIEILAMNPGDLASDTEAKALLKQNLNDVAHLVKEGHVKADNPNLPRLIKYACSFNNDALKRAVKPLMNSQDDRGWTLAHHAARRGDIELLQALQELGAKFNICTSHSGRTPLFVAQNTECARILLDGGANPDFKDNGGLTAGKFNQHVTAVLGQARLSLVSAPQSFFAEPKAPAKVSPVKAAIEHVLKVMNLRVVPDFNEQNPLIDELSALLTSEKTDSEICHEVLNVCKEDVDACEQFINYLKDEKPSNQRNNRP